MIFLIISIYASQMNLYIVGSFYKKFVCTVRTADMYTHLANHLYMCSIDQLTEFQFYRSSLNFDWYHFVENYGKCFLELFFSMLAYDNLVYTWKIRRLMIIITKSNHTLRIVRLTLFLVFLFRYIFLLLFCIFFFTDVIIKIVRHTL